MSRRWSSFDNPTFVTIENTQYLQHSYLTINPSWIILANMTTSDFALAFNNKIMREDFYQYKQARVFCETLNPSPSVKTADPSPTVYIKTKKKVFIAKVGEDWIASNKDGTKIDTSDDIGKIINYLIKSYEDRVLEITIYPVP